MISASDSTAPLGPLSFIAAYRNPDITYIYPAVHQLLLDCFYAVVLVVCKLTGLLGKVSAVWPYGMTHPTGVFTALILVSNLVSLFMGLVVLGCLRRIRLGAEDAPLAGMAILGLGGVFTYYARVSNMDMPYMFWLALAFICIWRFLFEAPERLRWLCAAGSFSAFAVGTKDQSIGVVAGFGFVLLCVTPRGGQGSAWRSRLRNAFLFSGVLILAYALAAVAPQPQRWWRHATFVISDHVNPEFEASVSGHMLLLARFFVRLSHVLSPAGIALAAAGVAVLLRLRKFKEAAALLLPPLIYYLTIIARVRATEERYLLPIAWPLCVFISLAVGAGLARRASSRSWPSHLTRLAVVLAIVHQFGWGFVPVTWTQAFDLKRAVARDLPSLAPPGSPLLITSMVSFNLPNSRVYDRYRMMHPPGEKLQPLSTHGENLFHPYDPTVRLILAGSPNAATPPRVPPDAVLLRAWTFPAWVKAHVHVPSVYEFFLFERCVP